MSRGSEVSALSSVWRAALLFVAIAVTPTTARASLREDAERLARAWKAGGATVVRLPPLFIEGGQRKALLPDLPASRASECITLAVLASKSAHFVLATGDSGGALAARPLLGARADEGPGVRSQGGAIVVERCGDARKDLGVALLEMHSPRGAVEVIAAAWSKGRKPAELLSVLPDRVGPVRVRSALPDLPLAPEPLAERAEKARDRALRSGASAVVAMPGMAGHGGSGAVGVTLGEGCHRIDVLPEFGSARRVDVDAEARLADRSRVLARDISESQGARLDFCMGERADVDVMFLGAAPGEHVLLVISRWPKPSRISDAFGPRARAGLAWALHRRGELAPAQPALHGALGVQGTTQVPLWLDPGRCYLGAVGVVRGDARGLRLSARVDDRTLRDDGGDRSEGVALPLCPDRDGRVMLQVDARARSAWWVLQVWPARGTP